MEKEIKFLCPYCGENYVETGHNYDVCNTCYWEDNTSVATIRISLEASRDFRERRENRNFSLSEQKKILRQKFLARRAAVPIDERDRISHTLTKKFLSTEIYRAAKILMAYASTPDELQMNELFAACLADRKTLAIPLIVGKGEMQAAAVPNFDALEIGTFNILTVKRELLKIIEPAQIDCVIVPGAAFDTGGGRLGLGGGYYDRFLPHAVNAKKIALAYDFQLVESLPLEVHDVKIDAVLTP